jgi:hypothetical protein
VGDRISALRLAKRILAYTAKPTEAGSKADEEWAIAYLH